MTSSGTTAPASCHRRSVISAITRKIDERHGAEVVDGPLRDADRAGRVVDVANDRGDDHRADVGRQRPAQRRRTRHSPTRRRRRRRAARTRCLSSAVRLDVLAGRRRGGGFVHLRSASCFERARAGARRHAASRDGRADRCRSARPSARPTTMPTIAADTASVAAPATPASRRAARRPAPSPDRRSASPSRPARPSADARRAPIATPAPTTFCSAAATDATIIITSTSGPPRAQHAHAGAEADRGEERVLQRHLQRGVEGQSGWRAAV